MIKSIIKKILALWLVVYLTIVPPFAYAASPAGWAFNSFNVATSVVTAVKNGASASVAVAKSPITAKIAKGIVGGAIAGVAIPLAISQLTGVALSAVDWVLDSENNAIKYRSKTTDVPTNTGCTYSWINNKVYPDPVSACKAIAATTPDNAVFDSVDGNTCKIKRGSGYLDSLTMQCNLAYTPTDDGWQSIPIPTVADKIYDNAKTDSASATVVNDMVKEYVNEGSADVALDNAKADADATHGCGTGTHWSGSACVADTPSTPSSPTDTPFDPSSIIDAINSVFDAVMSLPDVINNALDALLVGIKDFFQPFIDLVTDFFQWFKDTAVEWKNAFVDEYKNMKDWVKSDPPPPDDGIVPETPISPDWQSQANGSYVNFGGSCPAPVQIPISYMGASTNLTISYTPFCQFATMIKPAVILSAYLAGLLIISGGRTKE